MKLYFTHVRENDGENNILVILSDMPFNQLQNTSFMAQGAEQGTDDIIPFIWVFVTGQLLSEIKSSLDISKVTIVSEQEMDVGNINAFYQYKATLANGEIYNLLLSNPDGNLSRPNDYFIANGMFHGKVRDLPAGMLDGATIIRYKDLEDAVEDNPEGGSYDKLILAESESNEESNVSNTASLKVKDKNGNWVDISGISIKTHNLNKATTLYSYTTGNNYIYTSIHNLILGIDISNSIVTGYRDGAIFKPTNTLYSVVKARYDEDQGKYVLDSDGDVITIHDNNGNIYVRDSSGDVTIN